MSNKRIANVVLAAVFLVFLAAAWLRYAYPDAWWSSLLFYMAEAGLVGGLADWYAVTALFRHPLGMKGKHTAIVPRNRDKLIDGVVRMVETQLLPPDTLKLKLAQAPLAEIAIGWIDRRFPGGELARAGWRLLGGLLSRMDFGRMSADWDERLKELLRRTDITPYAGRSLRWLLENEDVHLLLDRLVAEAEKAAASPETKDAILRILEEEKDKQLNEGGGFMQFLKKAAFIFAEESDALNLKDAAGAIHTDLLAFLDDLKRHDHELRLLLLRMFGEVADQLEADTALSETLENWKNDVLARLSFAPSVEGILRTFRQLLDEELTALPQNEGQAQAGEDEGGNVAATHAQQPAMTELREWTERFATDYWEAFKRDAAKKAWVDGFIKSLLGKLVDAEHRVIGQVARETLNAFTEQRLIAFIEDKVGEDLNRIRINGSLVGAGLGALIYLFLHGVYDPLLDAFVR
ncbi:DUF445 domain-containing protein [Paenibacillus methanolicus]|uniref:Uncharacterized membrane-anchored protein YjiN (DUF445 family) n=1 Tax=Paenibacillus methanolicus TaxID=582686 RepID=A0A5S5BZH3_9BACL|nr:DUF445 domain-containing protein [Paenibacillus methanolicus]TYP71748.1 uncharacterized membrane-anchored protein YjiN (DUF445 family) [Paenibacillus methanolicus]